uniref:Uncharacterized protein n=1 Tax=Physcomitrium patens TaxID=3218 RepID=A0A2K1J9G1_PHYPA|nr:hypothetical protein PHYPA_021281 [Physcomitrium patens]
MSSSESSRKLARTGLGASSKASYRSRRSIVKTALELVEHFSGDSAHFTTIAGDVYCHISGTRTLLTQSNPPEISSSPSPAPKSPSGCSPLCLCPLSTCYTTGSPSIRIIVDGVNISSIFDFCKTLAGDQVAYL